MENPQTTKDQAYSKPVRPTFITVLCILTFIGSGWGIVSGISGYLTADTTADVARAAMEDAKDNIQDQTSGNSAKLAERMLSGASETLNPENIKKNALFSIVASICTLVGGILMFNLKKAGFWTYLVGTIVGIAGPFIAFGGGNILTIVSSSATAFVGIIFVILYALNVKHLR